MSQCITLDQEEEEGNDDHVSNGLEHVRAWQEICGHKCAVFENLYGNWLDPQSL